MFLVHIMFYKEVFGLQGVYEAGHIPLASGLTAFLNDGAFLIPQ